MFWDKTACWIEYEPHTAPHQNKKKEKEKASSMQTDTTAATNYSQALLKVFTLTCRHCTARSETAKGSTVSGSDEVFHLGGYKGTF